MQRIVFAAIVSIAVSLSAHALPIHETWVSPLPTAEQVHAWSKLPGTRTFLIQAADPFAEELSRLLELRGWDRLRVESARYPSEADQDVWKKLAQRGAEFIALGAGYPTDAEVARLNQLNFSQIRLVLPTYPGPEDAARIAALGPHVSITFAAGAYPKYMEKPGFEALPAHLPLLFVTDYWPNYSHLDFFNLIAQPISLRVSDSMPPAESLPYLAAIKRLGSIAIETAFDPQPEAWKALAFAHDLRWTSVGHVPTREALAAFEGPGHALIVDQDAALSDEERHTLEASKTAVEWIHGQL